MPQAFGGASPGPRSVKICSRISCDAALISWHVCRTRTPAALFPPWAFFRSSSIEATNAFNCS